MKATTKYQFAFTKMHGAGNDFVLFKKENVKCSHGEKASLADLAAISKIISNRKLSVGCDQVIIVSDTPTPECDYEMLIFNSDGSQANMCGNGVRCFSKYIIDNCIEKVHQSSSSTNGDHQQICIKNNNGVSKITNGELTNIVHKIHTLAGTIKTRPVSIESENDVMWVNVNMGFPFILRNRESDPVLVQNDRTAMTTSTPSSVFRQSITITNSNNNTDTITLQCVLVSMGNPHCVIFLSDNTILGDDLKSIDVSGIGKKIGGDNPLFYDGCNVEFVDVKSSTDLDVRVWERGAGETLACGTGASAVAVASILTGRSKTTDKVAIHMPGGDLLIDWYTDKSQLKSPEDEEDSLGRVFKTGPACTVYNSTINI